MSRYIDADKLLELYKAPKDMPEWDGFVVPIPLIRQNILDMPTVDVVVLPCPIGTMVYRIRKVGDPEIGYDQLGVTSDIFDLDLYYQFGKTVFLTKQEARNKLNEMEGVNA